MHLLSEGLLDCDKSQCSYETLNRNKLQTWITLYMWTGMDHKNKSLCICGLECITKIVHFVYVDWNGYQK